jgi:hypothetical protein
MKRIMKTWGFVGELGWLYEHVDALGAILAQ